MTTTDADDTSQHPPTRPPVVVERDYAAPPERVFAAWTDVALLTTWWGCAEDMLWDVHEWDPTPGGAIHVSLDFPETGTYEVRGQFTEVEPPHRLRYDWEAGQVITVTIQPIDGGSRMRIEHAGLPSDEMFDIVTGGWSASVEQILVAL